MSQKNRLNRCSFFSSRHWKVVVVFLFLAFSFSKAQASEEKLLKEVDQLRQLIVEKKYDQAGKMTELLRGSLYDEALLKKEPELKGNTYINSYFKLQISNPVEEWQIKKYNVADDIYRKQNRSYQNLIRIENPSSPYEIRENLTISVYDVGHSLDANYLSKLDFRPAEFLKSFVGGQLNQMTSGGTLVKKEAFQMQGMESYRVIVEMDAGGGRKGEMISIFSYVPSGKYVLIFSFIMEADNFSIYEGLLDAILETLVVGDGFEQPKQIVQKSFMDIYLERSQK